jgi:hypothetical protein
MQSSRGEDLQIEEPVSCGQVSAFHFYTTLAGMLGPTLIGNQVVGVCQSSEKRLLAATWMVKPLHREEVPLEGVVGLIQQRAGHRHLRVFKHRIPTRLLAVEPASYALAVGHPCAVRHMIGNVAEPLTQRTYSQALPLSCPLP